MVIRKTVDEATFKIRSLPQNEGDFISGLTGLVAKAKHNAISCLKELKFIR